MVARSAGHNRRHADGMPVVSLPYGKQSHDTLQPAGGRGREHVDNRKGIQETTVRFVLFAPIPLWNRHANERDFV